MKSTRQKVEEWLIKAPKEILIISTDIEEVQQSIRTMDSLTKILVTKGFDGNITFQCKEWGT